MSVEPRKNKKGEEYGIIRTLPCKLVRAAIFDGKYSEKEMRKPFHTTFLSFHPTLLLKAANMAEFQRLALVESEDDDHGLMSRLRNCYEVELKGWVNLVLGNTYLNVEELNFLLPEIEENFQEFQQRMNFEAGKETKTQEENIENTTTLAVFEKLKSL